MKQSSFTDNRGIGHVVIIVAIAVAAAVALGGWFVYQKNDNPPANANTEAVRKALENVKCDTDDKDICKFFASWKATRYYTAKMTVDTGRTTNTTVVQVAGDRNRTKINAELTQETISIGNTLYTKDSERNMWYKQTSAESSSFFNFDASKIGNSDEIKGKPTYKKVGKEKCGALTCFKYQVSSPTDRNTKFFLWFDDKDYQLRKQTIESPEAKSTVTFNYDKVTIEEPSPYEELDENEVYIPGQGVFDPSSIPGVNTEELNQLLEQYQ
jgi:outer membrane lipoprotein-sorting protein